MSQPATTFRDGCLSVVIWRNTSTEGRTYYSANVARSYKAGDDTWKRSDSLRDDDMLPMAKLLDQADTWMKNAKKADAKAAKERDNVTAK